MSTATGRAHGADERSGEAGSDTVSGKDYKLIWACLKLTYWANDRASESISIEEAATFMRATGDTICALADGARPAEVRAALDKLEAMLKADGDRLTEIKRALAEVTELTGVEATAGDLTRAGKLVASEIRSRFRPEQASSATPRSEPRPDAAETSRGASKKQKRAQPQQHPPGPEDAESTEDADLVNTFLSDGDDLSSDSESDSESGDDVSGLDGTSGASTDDDRARPEASSRKRVRVGGNEFLGGLGSAELAAAGVSPYLGEPRLRRVHGIWLADGEGAAVPSVAPLGSDEPVEALCWRTSVEQVCAHSNLASDPACAHMFCRMSACPPQCLCLLSGPSAGHELGVVDRGVPRAHASLWSCRRARARGG